MRKINFKKQIIEKTMKTFFEIFLILLISKIALSQSLPVQLQQPPVYSFFTEDMFKLSVTNTSQETFRIYLHGRATERTKGMIVDASSSSFLLPPGTKYVKTSDAGKITINEKNETYKDVINRMGQLPTGNYDICIEVINEANGIVIGSDCISHEVLLVSQVSLVYPANMSQNIS